MKYRTRDGDMLDQICLAHYGRVDVIEKVLEANPSLAEAGPVLRAGLIINLPEISLPGPTTDINLWD
ncbi:tail protein X [Candidatus Sororendozoicomonas aggregata]|uniref:tail protein X n=1 Tax=Candidatus Sororendozoicomonas aggregata TaxID=3073239 RepID=UPI002ED258DE